VNYKLEQNRHRIVYKIYINLHKHNNKSAEICLDETVQ